MANVEKAAETLLWCITRCDVEGCSAWATWIDGISGQCRCQVHKTRLTTTRFAGWDNTNEQRIRTALDVLGYSGK